MKATGSAEISMGRPNENTIKNTVRKGVVMPLLFSPISIKTMKLKNRIVFPPIATNYGLRNKQVRQYLTERARGGAGLVIIQGTPIELLASEKWTTGLKPIVDSVQASGAAIGIQLWAGNILPDKTKVAPSARNEYQEVSVAQLEMLTKLYAAAAGAARNAGFDTIDIHGAHGYFLHQFYSPLTNQRQDRFGGSVEKRIAFPLQCIRAIRTAVGADYPVMYRLSAIEQAPGGITLDDSLIFARALEAAGVDILDVSAGGQLDTVNISIPTAKKPLGTHAPLAAAIKQVVAIPVMAVGKFNTLAICEEVLKEEKADLIAVGRQLLADPYWPVKLKESREEEVIRCLSCSKLCSGNYRKNKEIACEVNEELGREYIRYDEGIEHP
jgi:2,4-dienoyl-CoA reductase-like NADH-dependent reductase (Old Yellow Enzyme family)